MPRAPKFLTREDIERAMKNTLSNRAASRFCRCSIQHYRKYAMMYKNEDGIPLYMLHFNRGGKGIPKFSVHDTGRNWRKKKDPPIMDIIEGRVPAQHFDPQKLKYRMIKLGLLTPSCSVCGFKEKRLVDGKSPLILKHKDGDNGNWRTDNLEFLCYNHAFMEGGSKCPVTEEFVEKQEDYVDRNGTNETQTWELDDYQQEFLRSLGIHPEEEKPYKKYISKI